MIPTIASVIIGILQSISTLSPGSILVLVECRTPEREVGGSRPTAAVLCP